MPAANQVHSVLTLTQGLQVIGDGEIGAIVVTGFYCPMNEFVAANARKQFETDQVDRR